MRERQEKALELLRGGNHRGVAAPGAVSKETFGARMQGGLPQEKRSRG